MASSGRSRIIIRILGVLVLIVALATGLFVGLSAATMQNIGKLKDFNEDTASLPTQVLDIKGRVITEFFSDEKRSLVKLEDLPPHLIYALITREDQDFFYHHGFSFRGFFRAFWNIVTGHYVSGGSTITQQLAGFIYLDRSEISLTRKIKELWYAIQLERNWSKNEILEEYLNKMPFGHGTYGVEAASEFYFGHPAKELSVAESAMLVIQLSSVGGLYSPLRNPENARARQHEILDQMVGLGYVAKQDADASFAKYWREFDYTREPNTNAFFERTKSDLAPYFSEYVREQLQNEYLLGNADIYRDGYKVYTTLNLDQQAVADTLMTKGIADANSSYQANMVSRAQVGEDTFVPIVDLLSLSFNMSQLRVGGSKQLSRAEDEYQNRLNGILDLMSMQFNFSGKVNLRDAVAISAAKAKDASQRSIVQGALITLDNQTGGITAMVGGSKFEASNQVNRATQGKLQPGSAFKPLYYVAGIEKGVITPATMIYDSQVVFTNDDGTPYTPLNFRGEWKGPVLVRDALAHSMNVPSLRILNRIGFDDAISFSSRLLGVPQDELASRHFERRYPLGLGVVSVSPLEMAKAFSEFANLGREVTPIAIRYITDKYGKIIAEPERDAQEALRKKGAAAQLVSPQAAYIMTDMLQSVVDYGSLYGATLTVKGGMGNMPYAGKTGTPQNWSAAWTVGYSPYFTTAVWIGFDKGGNTSLGIAQTGATSAGPIWANFMKQIDQDLPTKKFARPDTGLSYVSVVARSGLLPPPDFTGKVHTEIFKAGTEPQVFDDLTAKEEDQLETVKNNIRDHLSTGMSGDTLSSPDLGLNTPFEFKFDEKDQKLLQTPASLKSESDKASPSPSPSTGGGGNSLLD